MRCWIYSRHKLRLFFILSHSFQGPTFPVFVQSACCGRRQTCFTHAAFPTNFRRPAYACYSHVAPSCCTLCIDGGFAIRFDSIVRLVDVDAELAQVHLGNLNLLHQLLVRLGHVVECEDAPAEAEQQRRAEADEQPEGKLQNEHVSWPALAYGKGRTRTTGTTFSWNSADTGKMPKCRAR